MTTEEHRTVVPDDASVDDAEALIRQAHRRTRQRRARVGALAAAGAGVVAGIVSLIGSGPVAHPSTPVNQPFAVRTAPSPTTFVLATSHGLGVQLGLYSARSGVLVRRLASFRSANWNTSVLQFGTDGMALSANGRFLYFSAIHEIASKRIVYREEPRIRRLHLKPLEVSRTMLMRLNLANDNYGFVAYGAQPALNRTATELAYAALPHGLAVRDLRTGQTRTVALGELDTAADLVGSNVAWLGDGTDIAVLPSATAWDLMGKQPHYRWCGTSQRRSVIVFVHVPPAPAALTSTCLQVPGLPSGGPGTVISSDAGSPTSVLVASAGKSGTVIEQVSRRGDSRPVARIASGWEPIAFDTNADHLLYLTDTGHGAPTITEATIGTGGRSITGRWRDRHVAVVGGAW
jgi:hypothetical protein